MEEDWLIPLINQLAFRIDRRVCRQEPQPARILTKKFARDLCIAADWIFGEGHPVRAQRSGRSLKRFVRVGGVAWSGRSRAKETRAIRDTGNSRRTGIF